MSSQKRESPNPKKHFRDEEPKRVVVAMSGGVDSSVAAALLVEAGYKVIGMMMRLWSEPSSDLSINHNRCCTPDQMADARRVAQLLNIPFYVLDSKEIFFKSVVEICLTPLAGMIRLMINNRKSPMIK